MWGGSFCEPHVSCQRRVHVFVKFCSVNVLCVKKIQSLGFLFCLHVLPQQLLRQKIVLYMKPQFCSSIRYAQVLFSPDIAAVEGKWRFKKVHSTQTYTRITKPDPWRPVTRNMTTHSWSASSYLRHLNCKETITGATNAVFVGGSYNQAEKNLMLY